MENPSYYAIIPANVRYSDISPSAKLLYGEITALTGKTGFCYATNAYFAKLYNTETRTVQRWKKELIDNNFILGEFFENTTKLYIVESDKNVTGGGQKCHGGGDKNVTHNNTRYNNTEDNIIFYSGLYDDNSLEYKKEKNISDNISSINELRDFLNKGKLKEDFFYKISDDDGWEKSTTDFFLHYETTGKIIKKKSADLLFRKWLKPKYETEKDRQDLISAFNQKNKNRKFEEKNTDSMIREEKKRKILEDKFSELSKDKQIFLINKALESFKGTPIDKLEEKRKMNLAKIKAIGQMDNYDIE